MLRQDALERNGLAPEDAAHASRRALGNVTLAIDEVRDIRTIRLIDSLWLDVRLAFRGLRKSPGFALVAIGTLALGIGANTAIFSVINAAFFAPYHVKQPEHLVRLWGQDLKRNILQLGFSVPKYEVIRDQQTSFTALGAATQLPQTLLLHGTEPIQVNGSLTTSSFSTRLAPRRSPADSSAPTKNAAGVWRSSVKKSGVRGLLRARA